MKINPVAHNHILIELECGVVIDLNDGTSERFGGKVTIATVTRDNTPPPPISSSPECENVIKIEIPDIIPDRGSTQ